MQCHKGVLVGVTALLLACLGCQSPPSDSGPDPAVQALSQERARADRLERELAQARSELTFAEETLASIDSGLLGVPSRADAVSTLADARIRVGRAAKDAPWSPDRIEDARGKLAEADRHAQRGHFGSALFFALRARRIAQDLTREAASIRRAADLRVVTGDRVNLRAGPSTDDEVLGVVTARTPVAVLAQDPAGEAWLQVQTPRGRVGWIYAALVAPR